MNRGVDAVDLVVLVADREIEETVKALLPRTDDLELGAFRFEVRRHPNRDGGCRTDAANFLRPFLRRFRHSLVLFDHDGCGSSRSRTEIQDEVDADLFRNGWDKRTKTIVIEPELEAWLWGDLVQTCRVLGWGRDVTTLRRCLIERNLWEPDRTKPSDPKKAMRTAMECAPARHRRKRSARIFHELARSAAVEPCRDPAFGELRSALRTWFPPDRA